MREWFRRIPSVQLFTADSSELCASNIVDVIYVAVPHHLHENLYLSVLKSGSTTYATYTSPTALSYPLTVAKSSAYNRDWKFGP